MTDDSTLPNVVWTKLEAASSCKPCSRSSHGLSLVMGGTKLVLYGGEHVARTPLGPEESLWIGTLSNDDTTVEWSRGSRSSRSSGSDGPIVTPPDRVAHAQASYKDKYVYIFGGRAGIQMQEQAMNDLWRFNVETGEWLEIITKSESPEARSFHKMVCIDDALYVFGGCGEKSGRLADMHKLDLQTNTWHSLGTSHLLRGRGGPNLIHFQDEKMLAVVAGFAGEETNDGHAFDLSQEKWKEGGLLELNDLRPRSVCCFGSFEKNMGILFGGEVDPSDRGHEGAGGFENDIVFLENGKYMGRRVAPNNDSTTTIWPETRGWSDATCAKDKMQMFLFGGLSGDDTDPRRLDDLWRLDIVG
eukprot:CAMPEP_0116835404 /NCGR_PEP_ID=MMETSP0418-20121206/7527_1 /TAXON_ID=1158023 /ORGANISM="Astrosyne radiata, Strain 13vi08-1A" /LENGTH=357 /DNA_ID=CAMNT_0004465069 /DNA_START=53 /DNA_END=1126 /DNA_ORIENTATION=-